MKCRQHQSFLSYNIIGCCISYDVPLNSSVGLHLAKILKSFLVNALVRAQPGYVTGCLMALQCDLAICEELAGALRESIISADPLEPGLNTY